MTRLEAGLNSMTITRHDDDDDDDKTRTGREVVVGGGVKPGMVEEKSWQSWTRSINLRAQDPVHP